MQLNTITAALTDYTQTSPLNRVQDLADLKIFDSPLIGVASAEDELFPQLRQPSIIIETYLMPTDWLPAAKSIISFFCHSLRKFALPTDNRGILQLNGYMDGLKVRLLLWPLATYWWTYSNKAVMKPYFQRSTPDLKSSIAAATGRSVTRRSLPDWEPSA